RGSKSRLSDSASASLPGLSVRIRTALSIATSFDCRSCVSDALDVSECVVHREHAGGFRVAVERLTHALITSTIDACAGLPLNVEELLEVATDLALQLLDVDRSQLGDSPRNLRDS